MTRHGRGEALAAAVAAMDRLRSPGGCPWDAAQTHGSLAPYAIEEAYELAEAAETGDRADLRGELGDLLLQVLFHARVAEEHPADPFDLDDVAQVLLDKLVRRHPHVFGDAGERSASEVEAAWHEIKKRERGGQDVLTGIPLALPALARAQKVARRLGREGLGAEALLAADPHPDAVGTDEGELGRELMSLVLRAEAAGVDAEAALRAHLRHLPRSARSGPPDGGPGAG